MIIPKKKPSRPANQRPSGKLVAHARDHVLDAIDVAAKLLTETERLALITALREDLDLRQSSIEYVQMARRGSRNSPGDATPIATEPRSKEI